MATGTAENTLVVVQLTGGNDFMNTIVPYTNGHYYDARKKVVVGRDEVLPIDDELAVNSNAAPFKRLYDERRMAIIQGIGYPDSNRSHFRGMDIWHTAEPDRVGSEGWLGQAVRELDPDSENVLTGVSIGPGLPRAMAVAARGRGSLVMGLSSGWCEGVTGVGGKGGVGVGGRARGEGWAGGGGGGDLQAERGQAPPLTEMTSGVVIM